MYWIVPFLILLSGCISSRNMSLSTEAWSEDNTNNLSRIYVGMSEEQVLKIMRHPYSQRTFKHNGDVYDVWFYVTRMTAMDQSRMVPQNLTPLTFKNGVLIGWGFSHYNYLLKQEAIGEQVKIDAARQKKQRKMPSSRRRWKFLLRGLQRLQMDLKFRPNPGSPLLKLNRLRHPFRGLRHLHSGPQLQLNSLRLQSSNQRLLKTRPCLRRAVSPREVKHLLRIRLCLPLLHKLHQKISLCPSPHRHPFKPYPSNRPVRSNPLHQAASRLRCQGFSPCAPARLRLLCL